MAYFYGDDCKSHRKLRFGRDPPCVVVVPHVHNKRPFEALAPAFVLRFFSFSFHFFCERVRRCHRRMRRRRPPFVSLSALGVIQESRIFPSIAFLFLLFRKKNRRAFVSQISVKETKRRNEEKGLMRNSLTLGKGPTSQPTISHFTILLSFHPSGNQDSPSLPSPIFLLLPPCACIS